MNVHVETKSSCEKKLSVEVLPDEFSKDLSDGYEEYRKKVKLEGFRKGKAPLAMVKRLYGKEIEMTVLDSLLQKFYSMALDTENIQPLSRGTVDDVEFEPEKHLRFSAIVEVEPSFEINDISGIRVTKAVRKIRDEHVDRELESMRYHMATRKTVDGPAEMGQFIRADIQQIDPKTHTPIIGRKWPDQYFKLGSNGFGEEYENQLVGVKTGESRKVHRTYPDDFEDRSLAGTTERYLVSVKTVESLELPPLDDELAKDMDEKYQSLDDLKKAIRTSMESRAEQESSEKMFRDIENALISRVDFDVPSNMLEEYVRNVIEQMKKNSNEKVDETYVREVYRPEAIRNLKWHFIRERLIRMHGIEAKEEEVNARIEALAELQNMERDKALMLLKSKKNKDRIQDQIVEEKLKKILEDAAEITITEVEPRQA